MRSHRNERTRLTTAGLIVATAGTLLMLAWAIFPAPAYADGSDSVTWTGNGGSNLPCVGGTTQWNLTGFGNVQNTVFTSVVLTVNGQQFVFQNPQGNNGSFQWDVPGPGTTQVNTSASASFSWTGDAPGNEPGITISHCTGGGTTTTTASTTPPSTSTTPPSTSTTPPSTSTTPPSTSTTPPSTSTTPPSSSTSVAPTTITPPDETTPPGGTTVSPTTVSPPGGTAFTGLENVIPLGVIALTMMTAGSGLMWAGSRRRRDEEE